MTERDNEGQAGLRLRARVYSVPSTELGMNLDPATRRQIGDHLRVMYTGLLDQSLPGRLLVLLSQLERRMAETSQ